jgi:excisionase family DNA binding protein
MNQLALPITDAAKAAGVGRSKVFEEIRDGRLRAVKIGRSTRIRIEDLRSWLDSRPVIQPKVQPSPPPPSRPKKRRLRRTSP